MSRALISGAFGSAALTTPALRHTREVRRLGVSVAIAVVVTAGFLGVRPRDVLPRCAWKVVRTGAVLLRRDDRRERLGLPPADRVACPFCLTGGGCFTRPRDAIGGGTLHLPAALRRPGTVHLEATQLDAEGNTLGTVSLTVGLHHTEINGPGCGTCFSAAAWYDRDGRLVDHRVSPAGPAAGVEVFVDGQQQNRAFLRPGGHIELRFAGRARRGRATLGPATTFVLTPGRRAIVIVPGHLPRIRRVVVGVDVDGRRRQIVVPVDGQAACPAEASIDLLDTSHGYRLAARRSRACRPFVAQRGRRAHPVPMPEATGLSFSTDTTGWV